MSIDTELYLLNAGLASGSLVAAWQAFRLRKAYRSKSSWVGATTFLLLGGQQTYRFLRLHSVIAEARTKGIMIDHLTLEQWLVGVVWAYAIIAGFIVWQHLQHREILNVLRENGSAT